MSLALAATRTPRRLSFATVLVPLGAVACLLPVVSGGLALLAGMALALTVGNPRLAETRRLTPRLLALSVVGLGAGMDLGVVARVGLHGLGYTVAGIALCLALGTLLGRALRVRGQLSALITIGTAICGGSAIAAAAPVLQPDEHDVSAALATVFLLNALALLVFPPIGHAAHLSPQAFGLWSALAIHDTSSVVGAALAYGGGALAVATTVKLARALWIVPLTLALGWAQRRQAGATARARRPWFIAGFVAAAALVTWLPALRPAGHLVAQAAHRALAATLFLIGAGLTRPALRAIGLRPLALGVALWLLMAGVSLAAIVAGVVG